MKLKEDIVFGHVLRRLRTEQGVTQSVLAERCGVSHQQMQKYETGANRVSVSMLFMLGAALGIAASEIIATVEAELRSDEGAASNTLG